MYFDFEHTFRHTLLQFIPYLKTTESNHSNMANLLTKEKKKKTPLVHGILWTLKNCYTAHTDSKEMLIIFACSVFTDRRRTQITDNLPTSTGTPYSWRHTRTSEQKQKTTKQHSNTLPTCKQQQQQQQRQQKCTNTQTRSSARAHTHTHAHTHARTHAHTHTHTRARAHTHTHARMHTHIYHHHTTTSTTPHTRAKHLGALLTFGREKKATRWRVAYLHSKEVKHACIFCLEAL